MSSIHTPDCRILIASPFDGDHNDLEQMLVESRWSLAHAWTCDGAIRSLCQCPGSVVIANRDLPQGGWRRLMDRLWSFDRPAELVVYSKLADERLWGEVLNLGGYDVLSLPFSSREVQHVVKAAAEAWKRAHPMTMGVVMEEHLALPAAL